MFPTQVGVILYDANNTTLMVSVPHTGGGDPLGPVKIVDSETCSPHRWG